MSPERGRPGLRPYKAHGAGQHPARSSGMRKASFALPDDAAAGAAVGRSRAHSATGGPPRPHASSPRRGPGGWGLGAGPRSQPARAPRTRPLRPTPLSCTAGTAAPSRGASRTPRANVVPGRRGLRGCEQSPPGGRALAKRPFLQRHRPPSSASARGSSRQAEGIRAAESWLEKGCETRSINTQLEGKGVRVSPRASPSAFEAVLATLTGTRSIGRREGHSSRETWPMGGTSTRVLQGTNCADRGGDEGHSKLAW